MGHVFKIPKRNRSTCILRTYLTLVPFGSDTVIYKTRRIYGLIRTFERQSCSTVQ